ncbi:hypothetical protein EVAR_60923_1 [Eumeta japonica]|uniref:Uncharacterized protein n=1 Tax=Eumeta variegata TaxID=151549 RepID=A0A4C1ZDT9_EUMVA|nr:hypothetical protein EVAR_60923_1 [Eumeta japonica]
MFVFNQIGLYADEGDRGVEQKMLPGFSPHLRIRTRVRENRSGSRPEPPSRWPRSNEKTILLMCALCYSLISRPISGAGPVRSLAVTARGTAVRFVPIKRRLRRI